MKNKLIELIQNLNMTFNGQLIEVPIEDYVQKILDKATIITIQEHNTLKAFIAYYDNDSVKERAFLTLLAVDAKFQGQGHGKHLLNLAIENLRVKKFKYFELEVLENNFIPIKLYKKFGFETLSLQDNILKMQKVL